MVVPVESALFKMADRSTKSGDDDDYDESGRIMTTTEMVVVVVRLCLE